MSGVGGEDSPSNDSRVCQISRGRVDRAAFPPEQIAEAKAVACEPPAEDAPLSRRSAADVHRLVIQRGIADPSVSTLVRWLRTDAIRPWLFRSWIFPSDPDFAVKAGRILDLYDGRWEGELLHPGIWSFQPTRSRPSRLAGASTQRCRRQAGWRAGSASSTPTSAAVR